MRGLLFAALLIASLGAGTAQAAGPEGTWLTESGETRVKIAPCGGGLCGDIVWVRDAGAKSVVGTRMMTMSPASGGSWSGKLTNYKDGKTYNGKMSMEGDNRLKLSGCVLGGLFCRNQTWTRAR